MGKHSCAEMIKALLNGIDRVPKPNSLVQTLAPLISIQE